MDERKEKRKLITLPEAKELLEKLDQEGLDQIQKRTLDYAREFSKTDGPAAKKMKEDLMKCGLNEEEAAEIANVVPKSIEEIRVFVSGWKKLLPTELLEKILGITSKAH